MKGDRGQPIQGIRNSKTGAGTSRLQTRASNVSGFRVIGPGSSVVFQVFGAWRDRHHAHVGVSSFQFRVSVSDVRLSTFDFRPSSFKLRISSFEFLIDAPHSRHKVVLQRHPYRIDRNNLRAFRQREVEHLVYVTLRGEGESDLVARSHQGAGVKRQLAQDIRRRVFEHHLRRSNAQTQDVT